MKEEMETWLKTECRQPKIVVVCSWLFLPLPCGDCTVAIAPFGLTTEHLAISINQLISFYIVILHGHSPRNSSRTHM